jgi:hypothetical protein
VVHTLTIEPSARSTTTLTTWSSYRRQPGPWHGLLPSP